MKKFKAKITSDYKNSKTRKEYKSEFFVAKYQRSKEYKIIIDREDDRRVILRLKQQEMEQLIKQLKEL